MAPQLSRRMLLRSSADFGIFRQECSSKHTNCSGISTEVPCGVDIMTRCTDVSNYSVNVHAWRLIDVSYFWQARPKVP